jgi:hypothetical protein
MIQLFQQRFCAGKGHKKFMKVKKEIHVPGETLLPGCFLSLG